MNSESTLEPTEANRRDAATPPFDKAPGKTHRGLWIVFVIALVLLGYGAWRYSGAKQAAQTQNSNGPGGRRSAGNMAVPVVVAAAQRADLPVYLNGLGTVTAFNTVIVKSRVDGQLVHVAFREGQFVNTGDLLLELDPRPYQVALDQAQGQLAKDQAQLNGARVDYQRYQKLSQEGVVPRQQFDTQSALVGQLEGAVRADQAQIDNQKLNLAYCRITAPISGRIGLRLVDEGNIVHASDSNGLLVITQLQPIAVIFTLPQDQLPVVYGKLRAGAKLPVEAYDRDDVTKIAAGTLLTIDNQIDPTTGTYKLKAVFDNADNALFPNQFVNIHLLVDTRRGLTVVPAAAVQRGPQGSYVYVVNSNNQAKIQPVTIALVVGNSIGLSEGLQPGQSVVIDGQDKLRDGSAIEARTPTGGAPAGSSSSNGSSGATGSHRGAAGSPGKAQ